MLLILIYKGVDILSRIVDLTRKSIVGLSRVSRVKGCCGVYVLKKICVEIEIRCDWLIVFADQLAGLN